MRLALHTVVCCCVFTTVLPLAKGATEVFDTSLRKRIRILLQNRMKPDLHSGLVTANERYSVGPQQDGNSKIVSPASSFDINIRPRRSSKSSGCDLVTCAYHDLLYRLHQINNSQKEANAPEQKISPSGYGRRRRRSLQDVTQMALQTEGRRQSTEAGQRPCRHRTTCKVA